MLTRGSYIASVNTLSNLSHERLRAEYYQKNLIEKERIVTIHCYAAFKAKQPLKKFTYEPKALGPLEVEIKISHCGICHSDVHLIDNDWGTSRYPLVPGHEIVGAISAVGKNVKRFHIGDRVGVGWQSGSCMECEWCIKGEENLCSDSRATCVGRYGGFAESTRTDNRFAFSIPANLESENAAPLLCGGITVYSPLRRLAKPSMKVGVVGIGGLGHLAIQFARVFGCEVTAFSSTAAKEKDVKNLGAHHFIVIKDSKQIKKMTKSLDFILSTAHVNLDWPMYLNILRPNGKLCLVGVPPHAVNIPAFMLIGEQRSVVGSVIGNRTLIEEMLIFAARHKIKTRTEVVPLREVNTAIKKIRENKARYRMVVKV